MILIKIINRNIFTDMAGELDSEPRSTCWYCGARWSWKIFPAGRLAWLVGSDRFKQRYQKTGEMASLGGCAKMSGSRAFLAQQPWIQNLTLRLFFHNSVSSWLCTERNIIGRTSSLGGFISPVATKRLSVSVALSRTCRFCSILMV